MRRGELKFGTRLTVGLTVGMFAFARTAFPQTINSTSQSVVAYETFLTTTVDQQVNDFSTQLIAQMPGGTVVFDQTFNVAYSDPTVQAAVAQAAGDLTTAGATSYIGPTQTSYLQALVGSSTITVPNSTNASAMVSVTTYIGPQTIQIGDFGVYQRDATNAPYTGPTGNTSAPFSIVAGGEDIDTLVTGYYTIYQTTTNTDTYLTTTVYEMTGVVVPEPDTGWLLGLGGLAAAWIVRRKAHIGKFTDETGRAGSPLPAANAVNGSTTARTE
jgi:hypothetical protein